LKEYVEKYYQLYETALEIFSGTDQFRVRAVHLDLPLLLRVNTKDIYEDRLFEPLEFDQSTLGTPGILYLELCSLTRCSLLGRGAATEGLMFPGRFQPDLVYLHALVTSRDLGRRRRASE
jgi:hypothetical protein